jgi:hypothetical protein
MLTLGVLLFMLPVMRRWIWRRTKPPFRATFFKAIRRSLSLVISIERTYTLNTPRVTVALQTRCSHGGKPEGGVGRVDRRRERWGGGLSVKLQ